MNLPPFMMGMGPNQVRLLCALSVLAINLTMHAEAVPAVTIPLARPMYIFTGVKMAPAAMCLRRSSIWFPNVHVIYD